MTNEERLLNELVDEPMGLPDRPLSSSNPRPAGSASIMECSPGSPVGLDTTQWVVCPDNRYRPGFRTVPVVPPGAYSIDQDNHGYSMVGKNLLSDTLVDLPDSVSERAVKRAIDFWASKEAYALHGLLFKTGMLFFGPPGSGKTSTAHKIIANLVGLGGIALFCHVPAWMRGMLKIIRQIEPQRPIIAVLEDMDEIIHEYGESAVLSVLDGEDRVENIIFLATTNYIGRLGARIVNRPARFDEPIYIGMPSLRARRAYLEAVTRVDRPEPGLLDKWAADTEGMSIAHLRELVAAVMCLRQPYASVLQRLKTMAKRPQEKDDEGFAKGQMGLVA